MSKFKTIFLLFFLILSSVIAQTDNSLNSNNNDSTFVMHKSPTGAMLRSAVLPGWGQFYNESYWKIPIVWGASGWFIYMWIDRNNLYKKYQDLYNISLTETTSGDSQYKTLRNFYRDNRDQFAIYFGIAYFLNIIDAYVDAHLFDFDVGTNEITHKPELILRIRL